MLVANVLAKLDATRADLEQHQKDLGSVKALIANLENKEAIIQKEINALECKIMELEDELDA